MGFAEAIGTNYKFVYVNLESFVLVTTYLMRTSLKNFSNKIHFVIFY